MNGKMIPKFMIGVRLPENYYSKVDPYAESPKSTINLLELSRYAKKQGKKIIELTKEEVASFYV